MKLQEFVGLDPKFTRLMRSAQAGRLVHALIFSGPHGTGKRSMAHLMAQGLLCKSADERPCGNCPVCKRVDANTHPDVHVVAPDKSTLRVDQIRELTDRLAMRSYEGGVKIAIIERADRMTESAQNALLKTLEEPTGDTLFMLLTDTLSALLPTIVSRCLQLRFRCLELPECAKVLQAHGIHAERAQLLAKLSQGSVGRALEIDADEDYLNMRGRVLKAIDELGKPDGVARATAKIGDVKGRESDVLEILELVALDLMRSQNGMSGPDVSLKTPQMCGSLLLRRVMFARQQLKSNVSWVNVLESMDFALAGQLRGES